MVTVLPTPDDTFRALLTQHRVRADLSQWQLARQAGMTPNHVHRIETGSRRPPGRDAIHRLAAVLDLDQTAEDRLLALAGHCPLWLMSAARRVAG